MPKHRRSRKRHGKGIFDDLLGKLLEGPRQHAPPAVRKFIEDNLDRKVVDVWVGKKPVNNPTLQAINILSLGQFEARRRQLGNNDINHAYLIITLDNGNSYRLEKNHVVEISPYRENSDEKIQVKLKAPLEAPALLLNAEIYQERLGNRPNFWNYDAQNNNCQYFVDDIIKANASEIENVDQVNSFSFQPEAGSTVENVNPILRGIIDVASTLDRVVHGNGIKDPRLRR